MQFYGCLHVNRQVDSKTLLISGKEVSANVVLGSVSAVLVLRLVSSGTGLDYWGHVMNPFDGSCLEEDYMKMNNKGTVPTLVDHRISLIETKTIVR